jgi:hypothetical protein
MKALDDAVVRNAANVISLPAAGLIRHFKSRFLGECDDGLWLEAVPPAIPMLMELIEQQRPVAVSFKSQQIKMSFLSSGIRLDQEHRINELVTLPAVLLAWPTEVKGMQRRASYRVRIPAESPLSLRMWSIPEQAHLSDRPMAVQEIQTSLRDISLGGIGISIYPPKGRTQRLVAGQRLRVELKFAEIEMLLEGRLRIGSKPEGAEATPGGIIFQKLETDVDGRRKLAAITRIVGQLHRAEVRRAHMGLAS